MASNIYSCDNDRSESMESLKYLDPGLDTVLSLGNYFSKVDNRNRTNNYEGLVKNATRCCKKMANPRLWTPINPSINLNQLVKDLDLDWRLDVGEKSNQVTNLGNRSNTSYNSGNFSQNKTKTQNISQPRRSQLNNNNNNNNSNNHDNNNGQNTNFTTSQSERPPIMDDERLKNFDERLVERILNEIVDKKQDINWSDIAGLENVKQAINEIVVYPMQNPDLFKGLLAPAKGLLLFGPPGTGKTLIGKCIAAESGATFFSISASSLTSKWIGEGEKMVRALFTIARIMQPSVVFIDEIDSLLTQRVDGEHDSSRRMKTEFLVQFDGVATGADDRLLIVGATNRPQELDEAARRRFTKRLYVPLPDEAARKQLIEKLMSKGKSNLTEECIDYVVKKTDGFSGADMSTLCHEAALASVRALIISKGGAKGLGSEDLPYINRDNFDSSLRNVKASVSSSDLGEYEEWDRKFGAARKSC